MNQKEFKIWMITYPRKKGSIYSTGYTDTLYGWEKKYQKK